MLVVLTASVQSAEMFELRERSARAQAGSDGDEAQNLPYNPSCAARLQCSLALFLQPGCKFFAAWLGFLQPGAKFAAWLGSREPGCKNPSQAASRGAPGCKPGCSLAALGCSLAEKPRARLQIRKLQPGSAQAANMEPGCSPNAAPEAWAAAWLGLQPGSSTHVPANWSLGGQGRSARS